jgi:hypothetical protein
MDNWLFVCKMCDFNGIYDFNDTPIHCPKCNLGFYSLRPYKESTVKEKFVNIGYKDSPRWSWSLGVNVQDIPAMMKKYPDREYHPVTGQLKVKNRPHKKRLMKEHNMYEMS